MESPESSHWKPFTIKSVDYCVDFDHLNRILLISFKNKLTIKFNEFESFILIVRK